MKFTPRSCQNETGQKCYKVFESRPLLLRSFDFRDVQWEIFMYSWVYPRWIFVEIYELLISQFFYAVSYNVWFLLKTSTKKDNLKWENVLDKKSYSNWHNAKFVLIVSSQQYSRKLNNQSKSDFLPATVDARKFAIRILHQNYCFQIRRFRMRINCRTLTADECFTLLNTNHHQEMQRIYHPNNKWTTVFPVVGLMIASGHTNW